MYKGLNYKKKKKIIFLHKLQRHSFVKIAD
jgi:hypothetical protein